MFALKQNDVQDVFLNHLISNEIQVTLITKNGVPITGVILFSDSYTIMLKTHSRQSLLFKAAISTIIPSKPIPIAKIFT